MDILALATTVAVLVCALSSHAAEPRPVRIALVSDTHVRTNPTGDHALYVERLRKAIDQVNAAKPDVVLFAGDLTENGAPEDLATFRGIVKALQAPYHWVPGNHDVGGKRMPGKDEGITEESLARCEKVLGPSLYVKRVGGIRVVGVNASLLGSGLRADGLQWAMIERAMLRTSLEPTVILLHNPLFLKAPDDPGGDYWVIEPEPRKRLIALAQKGRVRAVLSGHIHRPLDIRLDGIAYIGSPATSFGLPPKEQPEGWTMVDILPDGGLSAQVMVIK